MSRRCVTIRERTVVAPVLAAATALAVVACGNGGDDAGDAGSPPAAPGEPPPERAWDVCQSLPAEAVAEVVPGAAPVPITMPDQTPFYEPPQPDEALASCIWSAVVSESPLHQRTLRVIFHLPPQERSAAAAAELLATQQDRQREFSLRVDAEPELGDGAYHWVSQLDAGHGDLARAGVRHRHEELVVEVRVDGGYGEPDGAGSDDRFQRVPEAGDSLLEIARQMSRLLVYPDPTELPQPGWVAEDELAETSPRELPDSVCRLVPDPLLADLVGPDALEEQQRDNRFCRWSHEWPDGSGPDGAQERHLDLFVLLPQRPELISRTFVNQVVAQLAGLEVNDGIPNHFAAITDHRWLDPDSGTFAGAAVDEVVLVTGLADPWRYPEPITAGRTEETMSYLALRSDQALVFVSYTGGQHTGQGYGEPMPADQAEDGAAAVAAAVIAALTG